MTYTEQFYMTSIARIRAGGTHRPAGTGCARRAHPRALDLAAAAGQRDRRQDRARHPRAAASRLRWPHWGLILTLIAVPLVSLITKASFVVSELEASECVLVGCQGLGSRLCGPAQYQDVFSGQPSRLAAATLALFVAVMLAGHRGGWRSLPASP
jgi:hypothetical protein